MVKHNPCTGEVIADVLESTMGDVSNAVECARKAQPAWAEMPPVAWAARLQSVCDAIGQNHIMLADLMQMETGKSSEDARNELTSAVYHGRYFVGEGQRMYGRTTTSGVEGRFAMTIRQPCGVAALITAFNMPIANVAWKVFPALICGNTVVLKPSEEASMTASYFIQIAQPFLPRGVLNVVKGGPEIGKALVSNDVDVVSFTGSSEAGTRIGEECAKRNIKCSLEMGGKNAFVVCDDADLLRAVEWAIKSVFSLAGQRCASASRIIVFKGVYEEFKDALLGVVPRDIEPVINEKALGRMLKYVGLEVENGAQLIAGGHRMKDTAHKNGYYMAPTLLENTTAALSCTDLFGPIASLHKADDLSDAIRQVNDSSYGLTAAIHTQNINRAMEFIKRAQVGVVSVNAGTYGSEPHMPFGGLKQSGNGTREPGMEALDVYTQLKSVYIST